MAAKKDITKRYLDFWLKFISKNHSDYAQLDAEISQIDRAMEICLELKDHVTLGDFIDELIPYFRDSARWDIFIKYTDFLLKSDLEEGKKDSVMRQIALIEADQDYGKASNSYKVLLQKIKDRDGSGYDAFLVLGEVARLAILQGNYEYAQRVLEERLELGKVHGYSKENIDTLIELVKLNLKTEQLEKADYFFELGLASARVANYKVGEIDLLTLKASILTENQNKEDAIKYYQGALDVALLVGDKERASQIRKHMGVLDSMSDKQVFISYSHHDRTFANRLAKDLKLAGFSVWWDGWEIKVGHSIIKKVSEGISKSAYLAVILSPNSVKSDFVQRELELALMGQLSSKKIVVLPLLISDCEVPTFLTVIKWADFRSDYAIGLQDLIDTLMS